MAKTVAAVIDPVEVGEYLKTHSQRNAARHFKIGTKRMCRILRDAGVSPDPRDHGRRITKREIITREVLTEMTSKGLFYPAIAYQLGVCVSTVMRYTAKYGLTCAKTAGRPRVAKLASQYACKTDQRPIKGRQQPYRNPFCRFYDRCLELVTNNDMGMDCSRCQRVESGDGMDPVQTAGSHEQVHRVVW